MSDLIHKAHCNIKEQQEVAAFFGVNVRAKAAPAALLEHAPSATLSQSGYREFNASNRTSRASLSLVKMMLGSSRISPAPSAPQLALDDDEAFKSIEPVKECPSTSESPGKVKWAGLTAMTKQPSSSQAPVSTRRSDSGLALSQLQVPAGALQVGPSSRQGQDLSGVESPVLLKNQLSTIMRGMINTPGRKHDEKVAIDLPPPTPLGAFDQELKMLKEEETERVRTADRLFEEESNRYQHQQEAEISFQSREISKQKIQEQPEELDAKMTIDDFLKNEDMWR